VTARGLAKDTVERLLVAGGAAALGRRRRRHAALVLAYHNVVPEGAPVAGERSLHLPQARFARQLDQLVRTHDVVPLADLFAGEPGPRPRAAITFDDAYQGAMTAGVTELAHRGLPATFFVAPAFVGGGAFWWDKLADPATGELPDGVRRHALERLEGRDSDVRAWAAGEGLTFHEVPPHQRVATEVELGAATRCPGVTLGSHSWSHPSLPTLNHAELAEELGRPQAWLRERFPAAIPWLAYPYGLADAAVERAAAAAGYVGAVRISGGWVSAKGPAARHAVPRYNVPAGLSQAGFVLRAAGVGSS
jgi:peptidoglycan/xylan/chitin deacetylase (PgdA/CDA1 family)